ncbi:MAG TPA: hypothetical protein VGM54_06185 [Chthoniobacter sp.]|jgi:hypothetical protein
MISRFLGMILIALAVVFSTGCAGDPQQQSSTPQTDPNATSIPWNRPLEGEGQGPLSGMMPGQSR